MNAARRKQLAAIVNILEIQKADLDELAQAEQDTFDSLPDSLQSGERGQAMEQCADTLQQAADDLDNIISELSGMED